MNKILSIQKITNIEYMCFMTLCAGSVCHPRALSNPARIFMYPDCSGHQGTVLYDNRPQASSIHSTQISLSLINSQIDTKISISQHLVTKLIYHFD